MNRERYRKLGREGFTFIEILIVIAIVAIMAVMAVSSFGSARQKAKIDLLADNLVSLLQQQQQQARSGKSDSCYGIAFHTSKEGDEAVQLLVLPYKKVEGMKADFCDPVGMQTTTLEDMKGFTIAGLFELHTTDDLSPTPLNDKVLLFKPPFGELVMGEEVENVVVPEKNTPLPHPFLKVTVSEKNGQNMKSLLFDTTTSLAQRIPESTL